MVSVVVAVALVFGGVTFYNNLTEREAGERVKDFEGVENCMTEKEACQEAGRCLRCDHFGYGIFKGGRDTKW